MQPSITLTVRAFDVQRRLLTEAQIEVVGASEVHRRSRGTFVARGVPPGRTQLRVSAPGLQSETRWVEVGPKARSIEVILGQPGWPAYRKGGMRVPYEPRPGLVALHWRGGKAAQAALEPALQMAQASSSPHAQSGLELLHVPAAEVGKLLEKLRAMPEVHSAGPVVLQIGRSLAYFSGGILLRTHAEMARKAVDKLAKGAGAQVARQLTLKNMWLLRAEGDDAALLAACDGLAKQAEVASAEPELAFTSETDAITPTDELADEQWHLGLAAFPDAWQRLRDANPAGVAVGDALDLSFGSAAVTIAVIDEGVGSTTDAGGNVSANHVEFQGTVSSGQPKMAGFFDFGAMVANNDNPLGSHGVQCAGVAAAPANNVSSVAGEEEGVSGGAPNCRLLSVQVPVAGTETEFSDIYLWMAGLDPQSADPAFPAQLAQGAQVITNSAGGHNPAAFPVSDLMNETFERITDDARGGRGTLMLFFSAGNADAEFAALRPWANHARTFGVAASNESDRKADYSNFGDGIDFCAPSSDSSAVLRDITTTIVPGTGNLVGHTGGPDDYTDSFGGTSSATPLAAALGALLLSMDPTITWNEARDILCRTARRIDFANTDPDGQWRDRDGDGVIEYSNWYGHGRIDAAKAVRGAHQHRAEHTHRAVHRRARRRTHSARGGLPREELSQRRLRSHQRSAHHAGPGRVVRAACRQRGSACGQFRVRGQPMTGRSRMAAMIFSSPPPQFGQCCMSMSKRSFSAD
jgi:subtilisin family serine protease